MTTTLEPPPHGPAPTHAAPPPSQAPVRTRYRPTTTPAPAREHQRPGERQGSRPAHPAGLRGSREVAPLINASHGWDPLSFHPSLPTATRERGAITGPQSATTVGPADPVRNAPAVVVAAAEVLSGHRPAGHLSRHTTPTLYDALARRAGLARRLLGPGHLGARPRLTSSRVEPSPGGGWEVTVVLEWMDRVRAAAAHMEQRHGRWVLSSLEIA